MKRSISLQCDGAWRQALPCAHHILAARAGTFRPHGRQCIVIAKAHKSSQPTTESQPGVPSVIRRTALIGAAAPCLCALCGGGATKAAGRNPLYDRYFATVMRYGMEDYEAIIRPIKSQLFGELVQGLLAGNGNAAAAAAASGTAVQPRRVLEVGIGAGPNFPYYTAALAQTAVVAEPSGQQQQHERQQPQEAAATVAGARFQIVGLDPNAEMLRFAGDAAKAAGLQLKENHGGGSGSGLSPSGGGNDSLGRGSSSGGGSGGGGSGTEVWLSGAAAAEVSLVQGSAESLPFGDGEFDAAVVTLVMCSVPSPDKALKELRRVVRAGGRLLVIEHVAAGEGRRGLRLAQSLLTPLQRLVADGCSLNRDTGAALKAAGWQTGELRNFDLKGLSVLAPHIAGVLV